tara:strand:+ start:6849 stop:9485 length:2637 start_codon:yes stop_codon:yes gene_type:complete
MNFGRTINIGKYCLSICLILLFADVVTAQKTDSTTTKAPSSASTKSAVKDAVSFQSNDSLVVDFRNGRKAFLYGTAKVSHDAGTLTAGKIEMDLAESVVEAKAGSEQDTLSYPVLKRQSDEIKSTRILFNYKTQKGKFESARIQVPDGYLVGSKVKNVSKDEVYIEDGIYSTCPPDYLYYYIKAKKMKVVEEEEIFFSNARLYILDIPYPIVFPFGYVPANFEKKRSGLLTPTYAFQAQSTRGIGLQNLGWFQYFNDYFTADLSADIYTSGSFYSTSNMQYRKRDSYNGSIRLGYSRERGLESTDPGFGTSVQKSISVLHNQDFSPYSSVSSNINLRTSEYFTRNSYDIGDRAETNSSSKLSYKYSHPENLFNFSANSQLSQNFSNNSTTLSGPSTTFSLKTLTPFKTTSGNDPKWYESITFRYNNTLNSSFSFKPIDADTAEVGFIDALFDSDLYEEATGNDDYIKLGFKQTGGIQIGKLLDSPFLNLSGSANFNEYWYPSTTRKAFNADSNRVETSKEIGFVAARDFNVGVSFSTTFYGVSNQRIGRFQGLRHTMRPSVGFTYRPDFSDPSWGYYRTVQSDTLGNTQKYSVFQNQIFGGPGSGEQQALSFSISNVFETKTVSRDTTGEVTEKKIKLIDNLSLSTSYNLAADSLNLSNLSSNISSTAFKGLNLRASASFSFYKTDTLGREYNRFLAQGGGKLAQIQNFSISASTSFKGGRNGLEVFTPVYKRRYDPFYQGQFNPIDSHFNEEIIPPVNSPWSFSLNFNYSWRYQFNDSPTRSAVINAENISFNLTPKWRFSTRMGYDFIQQKLTPSQFNLNRSLECWDLSFQINPFGDFQYYFFRLSVNSAQIQSLFQKLPVLKNLERSSSPTGRGY